MWVKICANTTLEDALQAARAGADAVGFVFAPSKRQVTAEQVRAIVSGLPDGVEKVGVFGALPGEDIAAAARYAQLTAIQLHGAFDAGVTARLAELLGSEVKLIQTVHWALDEPDAEGNVAAGLSQLTPGQQALLDAKVAGTSGGLGVAFDWIAAGRIVSIHKAVPVILAGGLRPETVAEAVRTVKPWGVDVASGVESTPGKKDHQKVAAFIKNARGA